ncbi:hypothetical protein [Chryseobacterium luquanense]|uniref:Uncharacterized protein n=1 Tax=Chryseobacterium luquanense TaxID=2983766 RepID=A0ABT3Y4M1_9FLAO|nr:hypothetical protein [Chryseobacterium luquanense]MCX8533094.1 hypothetical protein [Chryseobacterium luquanense]
MHLLEFLEIDKTVYIPENMGECDRRQYLDMSKLVLLYQLGDINLTDFRAHGLYCLMNMEFSKNELESAQTAKMENVTMCSKLLDSFFRIDEEGKMHLIQDYIHNPVKSMKYKAMTFVGPKDSFSGMSYGQMEDGLGELANFTKTGDMECLLKLFSIFYLRPGEKYSAVNIDKRVVFFKYLDVRYVYGFYLLFVSFFNYLTTQCEIMVDGKEIDLTILFQSGGSTDAVTIEHESIGLRSTSFQLAESGVFGTLNDLRESDAFMVLIRMYDLTVRNMKEEKEMEAQRNKNTSHD